MKSTRERLEAFLETLPVEAKKSLGQNFLVSDHVVDKILAAARLFNAEQIIEVGPGPGALTDHLITWGTRFKVIELDRKIAAHWRNQGVETIEVDALKADWPKLAGGAKTILVSNLPYQISSSLVIERCLDSERIEGMVLMFQKEVAQRIRAQAGTSDYGLLSVIAQNFWDTKMVCEAGPKDFFPPPRVASRVLSFHKKSSDIQNPSTFLDFVKSAFAQRRKQLKTNITSNRDLKGGGSDRLLEWLGQNKKPATIRAEELSPTEMKSLYFHFQLE